ncbi:MAG TPA: hypothetical protein VK540_30465 [Polyangiaceae bacterium]|nr:hypothetical protein [Polyangiaceae bacterium]
MNRFSEIAEKARLIASLPAGPVARRFTCERCDVELAENRCVCGPCYQAQQLERQASVLTTARESIPAKFRWARLHSPDFAKRVAGSDKVIEAARDALVGKTPVVTIVGASGSGKTSLACAMLADVIEAGAFPTCDAKTLQRARYGLFVDAQQLALSRKEHRLGLGAPDNVLRARRASVLVIDELGREDKTTLDVAKIVHEREAACKLTIVTTWLDEAGVLSAYDGGLARRLFRKSILFKLGGGKS